MRGQTAKTEKAASPGRGTVEAVAEGGRAAPVPLVDGRPVKRLRGGRTEQSLCGLIPRYNV